MKSGQVGYKIKIEEYIPRRREGPMILCLENRFSTWRDEN